MHLCEVHAQDILPQSWADVFCALARMGPHLEPISSTIFMKKVTYETEKDTQSRDVSGRCLLQFMSGSRALRHW